MTIAIDKSTGETLGQVVSIRRVTSGPDPEPTMNRVLSETVTVLGRNGYREVPAYSIRVERTE